MAELSGHLAGACSGRRAEGFDLHIGNGGRIPLKEQAGIVLKTSHNPVLSLAETLPGNAADLCGQGILFGFAQETVVFVLINGTAISSFTSDKDSIYENKPAYNVKISIAGD